MCLPFCLVGCRSSTLISLKVTLVIFCDYFYYVPTISTFSTTTFLVLSFTIQSFVQLTGREKTQCIQDKYSTRLLNKYTSLQWSKMKVWPKKKWKGNKILSRHIDINTLGWGGSGCVIVVAGGGGHIMVWWLSTLVWWSLMLVVGSSSLMQGGRWSCCCRQWQWWWWSGHVVDTGGEWSLSLLVWGGDCVKDDDNDDTGYGVVVIAGGGHCVSNWGKRSEQPTTNTKGQQKVSGGIPLQFW